MQYNQPDYSFKADLSELKLRNHALTVQSACAFLIFSRELQFWQETTYFFLFLSMQTYVHKS